MVGASVDTNPLEGASVTCIPTDGADVSGDTVRAAVRDAVGVTVEPTVVTEVEIPVGTSVSRTAWPIVGAGVVGCTSGSVEGASVTGKETVGFGVATTVAVGKSVFEGMFTEVGASVSAAESVDWLVGASVSTAPVDGALVKTGTVVGAGVETPVLEGAATASVGGGRIGSVEDMVGA